MKRIVLVYGLIAGVIMSAMMLITHQFIDSIGFDKGAIVGYTAMVAAFLLVFFGVRSYRDNVAGGTVRFGRAFLVGALIAFMGSAFYVATWEVVYYKFEPDFMQKYQEYALAKARADGATEEAIARKRTEMEEFAVRYRNPVFNVAVSFLEPLPVALVMVLVSAGVLSRKRPATG